MLSGIDLSSRALIKLGANPISSFTEDSVEADVANTLYSSTRDAVLSAHPWTFATGQVTLAKLTETPVADFSYAYQLPADFLRAVSIGSGTDGRGIQYRISERRLHSDQDGINLTYIFRPDESTWPPFFDQVLITRLAAEFCIPITESTSRSDVLARLADIEFARAKSIDSQQESPDAIEDFSLINVRS